MLVSRDLGPASEHLVVGHHWDRERFCRHERRHSDGGDERSITGFFDGVVATVVDGIVSTFFGVAHDDLSLFWRPELLMVLITLVVIRKCFFRTLFRSGVLDSVFAAGTPREVRANVVVVFERSRGCDAVFSGCVAVQRERILLERSDTELFEGLDVMLCSPVEKFGEDTFSVATVVSRLVSLRLCEEGVFKWAIEPCFPGISPSEGGFCVEGTIRASPTARRFINSLVIPGLITSESSTA